MTEGIYLQVKGLRYMKRLFLHWRNNLNHTTGISLKQESIKLKCCYLQGKGITGGRPENNSEVPASKPLQSLLHNHKFDDKGMTPSFAGC